MHFNDDISISILNVIEFSRKKGKYSTKSRPFSALSLRINSSTAFSYRRGKVYANSDDIALVPNDVDYTSVTDGEKMIVIHFEMNNYWTDEIQIHTPSFPEDFYSLFEKILSVWREKKPGYRLYATSIMYQILSMIKKDEYQHEEIKNKNRYLIAAEYIERHFSEPNLSISAIAQKFNTCDALFRREFKKKIGISPKKYLDDIRINYAIYLLQTKYFSHQQIAEKCGFATVEYFRTAFKNKTGVCISKYNFDNKIHFLPIVEREAPKS